MQYSSPYKILFLSPLPPPEGGIATLTKNIVEYGLPENFEFDVINTAVSLKRGHYTLAWSFYDELIRTLKMYKALVIHLIKKRPHIVHINSSGFKSIGVLRDFIATSTARLFKVPVVCHYHGDISNIPKTRKYILHRLFGTLLIKISSQNIVSNKNSLAYANALLASTSLASKKATILPNFIDNFILENSISEDKKVNERLKALYIGNIILTKGCAEIIEIAKKLPEVDFALIGNIGADMQNKLQTAPENLQFLGKMPQQDLLNAIKTSDFLLFPSHSEGFPMVVLEAMAAGLPVIATPAGAIPEVVEENKGGYIVNIGDIEGFVTAIKKLIHDRELCKEMGKYNREKSRALYSYSAVITRLVDVYKKLLLIAEMPIK